MSTTDRKDKNLRRKPNGVGSDFADAAQHAKVHVSVTLSHLALRLRYILFGSDVVSAEILSGLIALGSGLLLLFNFDPTLPRSSVAAAMFGLLPATVWGTMLATVGFLQFIGAISGKRSWRRQASLVIGPVWTILTLVLLISGWRQPGFLAEGLFGLYVVWVNFRLVTGRFGDWS